MSGIQEKPLHEYAEQNNAAANYQVALKAL